jgi:hypothetical protein
VLTMQSQGHRVWCLADQMTEKGNGYKPDEVTSCIYCEAKVCHLEMRRLVVSFEGSEIGGWKFVPACETGALEIVS